MYKLYANVAGWEKISIAVDKQDIIKDMKDFSKKFNFYDFMIIKREHDTDTIELRIYNQEQYMAYMELLESEKQPLEDMSCVDLKRYILNKKGL